MEATTSEKILDRLIGIYFRICYMGFGENTEEDEEYIEQNIVCIPTGTGGYAMDKEYIAENLELGKEYKLDHMSVSQSSSSLFLVDFPNKSFNTVCFEYKIID